jgi:HEPN domain-containing protein
VSADAREWLSFASADLRAARLLLTDAAVPSRIACFHAHQAAEKAVKAVLIAESTPFRKTHDIVVLVGLAPAQLATNLAAVDILVVQPWAVDGRYPGDLPDATPTEAAEVVATAATILAVVADWLNTAP